MRGRGSRAPIELFVAAVGKFESSILSLLSSFSPPIPNELDSPRAYEFRPIRDKPPRWRITECDTVRFDTTKERRPRYGPEAMSK